MKAAPVFGIVPDGYWPDGRPRPWRRVEVIERNGRMATIRYRDDQTVTTVPAASIYSGNAPIDRPAPLFGVNP